MPNWKTLLTIIVALSFSASSALAIEVRSAPRMEVSELNARLGEEGLFVIDVRSERDWSRSERKIAGAVREVPNRLDWAQKYSQQGTLVLYCT